MELSVSTKNNTAIIQLHGSIMGGPDALQLNEKLHELGEKNIKQVILDLSDVSVINSSGLGMLIGGLTAMRNMGGDLKIAKASPKVETLLTVAKLQSVFPNYTSIEEAEKSFS